MFKADTVIKDKTLILQIVGTIDESFSLQRVDPAKIKEVQVFCKGVIRINSAGVKNWMKFFQSVSIGGIKFSFHECSTVVVEQFNRTRNFGIGGTIESVMVPFVCKDCGKDLVGMFKTAFLKKIEFQVADLKCPNCGGAAQFDDFPDEYFAFLKRAELQSKV